MSLTSQIAGRRLKKDLRPVTGIFLRTNVRPPQGAAKPIMAKRMRNVPEYVVDWQALIYNDTIAKVLS
jgi:hypothetical protein